MTTQLTAVSANDGKDFSHAKTNATSGIRLLAVTDPRARQSSTYVSQMTPSYAPITGDDLWRDIGAGWHGANQSMKRMQISEEDISSLLEFKLKEEARISGSELPDSKQPYLMLQKQSQI